MLSFAVSFNDFHLPILLNQSCTQHISLRYFTFAWDLDFATQDLTFIPFSGILSKDCPLCKFKPENYFANSEPKDLIIVPASGHLQNIVLFLKTLRTTGSKASVVFLLDKQIINDMDIHTSNFIRNCSAQVVIFDVSPKEKYEFDLKVYYFHLIELFLRYNQCHINRVIICDLFDVLFQMDPFHEQLPKNKIHIVDEKNRYNDDKRSVSTNIKWIKDYDPNFNLTNDQLWYKYWCAGYMEGPVDLMIRFLYEFNQIIPDSLAIDQGGFNYLNLSGRLQRANIPVSFESADELVRHCAGFRLRPDESSTFLTISAPNNINQRSAIIHHYYILNSDKNFVYSLLATCPREHPYPSYVSHTSDDELIKIENSLDSYKQNNNMFS